MVDEVYRFGQVVVELRPDRTVTRFPDGAESHGTYTMQEGQQVTARLYGLDVEAMNRGHDLAHSVLAAMLGLPWSPALRAAATGEYLDPYEAGREEAAVLSLQAWLRVRGISAQDLASRVEACV